MLGAPGLGAVAGVEGLVEEEAEGPGGVDPGRAVGVEGGVVVEEGGDVEEDEEEAAEGDEVWAGGVRAGRRIRRAGERYAMDMGKTWMKMFV